MRAAARSLAIAASATVALWLAGKPVLPFPPVAHPRLLGRWWSELAPAVAWFGALRALLIVVGLAAGALSTASLFLAALVGAGRRGSRDAATVIDHLAGWSRVAGLGAVLRLVVGIAGPGVTLGACAATQATIGAPGTTHADTASSPAAVIADRTPGTTTPLAPILEAPAGTAPGVWTPPVIPSRHPLGQAPASRVAIPPSRSPAPTASLPGAPAGAPPTTRPPAAVAPTAVAPTVPPLAPTAPASTAPSAAATPAPGSWTVRPGDDFWSIADSVVGASPSPGDTAGVTRYWVRLIQANRSRLADPTDPNLLFPGQVLVLPPP